MIGLILRKKIFKTIGFCLFDTTSLESYVQLTFKDVQKLNGIKNYSYIRLLAYKEGDTKAIKYRELEVEDYEIVSAPTETPPFELERITTINEHKLNLHRTFGLRSRHYQNIFYKKHIVKTEIKRTVDALNFVSVESPSIINTGLETGGSEMFKIDYYGKIKYLSQSPQMYKQIMVNVFDRIYEFSHIFRAEKSDSPRHLAEISAFDCEFVTSQLTQLIELLSLIIRNVTTLLGVPLKKDDLTCFKYSEVCSWINKTDSTDFTTTELINLEPRLPKWYYITHYPATIRPFYTLENGVYSESFDLYFNEVELASGSLRVSDYHTLLNKFAARNMALETHTLYLENFKWGSKPHGGFGLGLDRLLMVLLNLPSVNDCVPFPRSYTTSV